MFGNWLKTSLLMAAIVALFGTVGALLGGAQGMLIALVLGGAMNLWAYWFSDKMVLRMYNAREVDESTAPSSLPRWCASWPTAHGIPMPRVYLIDEDQPNAFATGRNPENAAVAATTGIMRHPHRTRAAGRHGSRARAREAPRHLDLDDLGDGRRRDLLARSVRHVLRRPRRGRTPGEPRRVDTRCMIVAPIAAMLIQFAISRAREFEADRGGARVSGDPRALASALEKIHRYAQGIPHGAGGCKSRDCADDDHEPPVGRRSCRALQHPP